MKKIRKRITTILAVILAFSSMHITAVAAEIQENRDYYMVVEGTATKLGTDDVQQVSDKAYLEVWKITEENVEALSVKTKNLLLNASNSDKLPIDEVTYQTLKALAEEEMAVETVYQGYARLRLKEAVEGYTYAVIIQSTESVIRVNGYYVDLLGKSIYKLDLICKKSSWSQIKKLQPVVEISNSYSTESKLNTNDDFDNYLDDYSEDSRPSEPSNPTPSDPTPSADPTPSEPEPPTPPSRPPLTTPSIPDEVLPGATTEG